MKQIFKGVIGLCTVCCISFCGSSKDMHSLLNEDHFWIGNGGGFTGKYVEYHFLPDGSIAKVNTLKKDTIQMNLKLDKKLYQQLSEQVNKEVTRDQGEAANMSSYLGVKTAEKNHRIIWNSNEVPRPTVETLYKILNSKIKEAN